jgi:hypothetical protein
MTAIASIPDPAESALRFFAAGSLLFSLLGTAFAQMHSQTLEMYVKDAYGIVEDKDEIASTLWDSLLTLKEALESFLEPDELVSTLPDLGKRCRRTLDKLGRLQYIMEHHLGVNYAVLTIILLGVVFCFVSLFIFAIATEHKVVWAPLIVLVALAMVWLSAQGIHHNPDIWKELPLISGWITRRRLHHLESHRDQTVPNNPTTNRKLIGHSSL